MKTTLSNFSLTLFALVSLILSSGCYTAQKALDKGDFDTAIHKAEKRLKGKKTKDKHVLVLEEAYAAAFEQDLKQIDYLQKADMIANWKKVLAIYKQLDSRQTKLERYLPLYISSEYREAEFETQDFKTEIANLKNNAAEYLYRSANNLMESKSKADMREAYQIFTELKKLKPNYKSTNQLRNQALALGKNYVLVEVETTLGVPIPSEIVRELNSFQTANLNSTWLEYHTRPIKNTNYDYRIEVNMNQMIVSPGLINENVYVDKRKIEDGWDYVLDNNGNVKKDSLGNDIKVKKYKEIRANILETAMNKSATVGAKVKIFSKQNQLLRKVPVEGNAAFAYNYATVNGDLRALSSTSKKKLKNKPAPFPHDLELLMQAGQTLKPVIYDAIRDNRGLLVDGR